MATMQWKPLPFPFVTPGEVFSVGLVFPLVCIGLAGARLYVRRLQRQRLGPDDWTAVLGIPFLIGMGACLMTGERMGIMGYPMPVPVGTDPTKAYGLFNEAYMTEAKLEFAFQFLQCFEFGLIKASIILFCRRIFVSRRGTLMDWCSAILLAIVVLWSVGFLFALIFGCGKNVALHWAPLQVLEESGCDGITPEKANLYSDPILDLLILVLPFPSIWRLNMSTGKKLAVTAVFLVGIMSLAASVTRLAMHITVLNQGYGAGYDINQAVTTLFYWSMVEGGTSAMVANLPTLNFLFRDRMLWQRLGQSSAWSSIFRPFTSSKGSASTSNFRRTDPGTESSHHPSMEDADHHGLHAYPPRVYMGPSESQKDLLHMKLASMQNGHVRVKVNDSVV